MKSLLKNLLVVLLLSITVFSAFKYVKALKDHYRLEGELKQAKTQLSIIREEKQNLLQRIEKEKEQAEELRLKAISFKEHLLAAKKRLVKLVSDYRSLQAQDRTLNSQVTQLKEENRLLYEEKARISEEKEELAVRLGSLEELKKAIRELRKKRKVKPEKIEKPKPESKYIDGNQGYLIKNGKTTFPARIRIEVVPVP